MALFCIYRECYELVFHRTVMHSVDFASVTAIFKHTIGNECLLMLLHHLTHGIRPAFDPIYIFHMATITYTRVRKKPMVFCNFIESKIK